MVDRVIERHPHKGKSRFPQAILLASSRSATSQLKPALAEDSKPPDDGPEGVCGLQPGQSAPKTGLDSGAGAASNRGFFQSKKGGWGPVTNWRFAPSLYDAESRVPPRDSPRFAGGRKPRSRYWAIPALSVYQNRDFRQGEHHQSLCQSQLSQQGRQLGHARETRLTIHSRVPCQEEEKRLSNY